MAVLPCQVDVAHRSQVIFRQLGVVRPLLMEHHLTPYGPSVRVVDAETGLVARKCLAVAWPMGAPEDDAMSSQARRFRRYEAGEGGGFRLKAKERDGAFEARVEPGEYRLTVESPEFVKWEGTVRVVEPPEETRVPEVRLARRRARVEDVALTVHVELEPGGDGWPSIQVEVLDPLDGSVLSMCRSGTSDRRYWLSALSGDWRLRVTAKGYETLERAMRLPEADPEPTVTVRLRPR